MCCGGDGKPVKKQAWPGEVGVAVEGCGKISGSTEWASILLERLMKSWILKKALQDETE